MAFYYMKSLPILTLMFQKMVGTVPEINVPEINVPGNREMLLTLVPESAAVDSST